MSRRIDVPPQIAEGFVYVANMSGGKDSTAMSLALTEAGIPHRRVFADTGWEAPDTYAYLNMLREKIGPIDVVGYPGGMVAKILEKTHFPTRMRRWCTLELKMQPIRAYLDAIEADGAEAVSVVGIRGQESSKRAQMLEVEDDREWGGWIWRPLISWTVEDVIAIHHRHGVPLNPMYHRGHDRVGCFPCVMATKNDLRLLAEYGAERIAQIRDLERAVTAGRKARNESGERSYAHELATMFQIRGGPQVGIDDAIKWAKTERGGRQLPMFAGPPDGGCFRWGVCDSPIDDDERGGR